MKITLYHKGRPVYMAGLRQRHPIRLQALLHFALGRRNNAVAIGDDRRSDFWFNVADRLCRLQRLAGEG